MPQGGPVEEVVHDSLVLGHQLVKLVHEHHTGGTARTRVAKLPLQEIKGLGWTSPFSLKGLPEKSIRLVRIRDLHTIDLDEDKVIELV